MDIQKFTLNETSYFGEGARKVLPEEIKKRGFKKVLVVTDASLYDAGVTTKVTDLLDANNIKYAVYHDVKPNPPVENVLAGVDMCKKEKADLLVAVGGGSSIDTAKGISIVITNPTTAQDLEIQNSLPFCLIIVFLTLLNFIIIFIFL